MRSPCLRQTLGNLGGKKAKSITPLDKYLWTLIVLPIRMVLFFRRHSNFDGNCSQSPRARHICCRDRIVDRAIRFWLEMNNYCGHYPPFTNLRVRNTKGAHAFRVLFSSQ